MTPKPSRKRNARHYTCHQKGYKGLVSGYIRDHNNEEVARVVVRDPVERDRLTRLLCDAMNRARQDIDYAVRNAKPDEAAGITSSSLRDQLHFLLESHQDPIIVESGDVEALKAFLRSLARS